MKKQNATVQLITYGTLMTGERNHHFCRNAVSIQPCTILGTLYDTGYGFPAFVPEGETLVKAELMEIPITAWSNIDSLEGYPKLYDRRLYQAKLADGSTVDGWVYIMNKLPRRSQAHRKRRLERGKSLKKVTGGILAPR